MQCAISGETPQEPVASKKSGNVFERRLVEAYISEHHKDPITNEELDVEDLVALHSPQTVKPRPPTFTSIPSLLSAFQNEWDSVMLDNYALKQQLGQLKQELAQALYNNDAAVRVISRLSRERNEAREALSKMSVGQIQAAPPMATPSVNGHADGGAMQVDDGTSLPADVASHFDEFQAKTSQTRRKRPVPEGWTTVEKIQSFDVAQRQATLVPADSKAFDLNTKITEGGKLALIGGCDGSACIYNVPKDETMRVFQPGDAAVTDVVCVDFDNGLRSATSLASGEVKFFNADSEMASFKEHAGSATALGIHPSRRYLASVGEDKSFVLYDVAKKEKLTQIYTDSALTSCQFHPDGNLLAVGSKTGTVSIFTPKTGKNEHTFTFPGPIASLAFSENGLWLAVAVTGSPTVEIITLSKMNTAHTLDFGDPIDTLEWDYTGQFLAAGGAQSVNIHAYDRSAKTWSQPLKKAMNVVAVHWGPLAKGLVALTADGILKVVK
ncbi:MAG: hypothetical protein Q9159_001144 [Coniocarpon cinnabarinum]